MMVGQFERDKDVVQVITESAATHVGNIAVIITGAIRNVAKETGELLTDLFEMSEAANRAKEDHETP
jgi:hypothetical protein